MFGKTHPVRFRGLILFFIPLICFSQGPGETAYATVAVGFWNVENLYDTLDDKWKNDDDFTPGGLNRWTASRYKVKINRLAGAIAAMAKAECPQGLSLIGLCEIENKTVLQDLILADAIKDRSYQFIHMEGKDARGIDPALIYDPKVFHVKKVVAYNVQLVTDTAYHTRDILVVSGMFYDEPLVVIVNHWPSRRGGELESRPNRNSAAKVVKHVTDSISSLRNDSRMLVMGDFNDDPFNESIRKIIGTTVDTSGVTVGKFFNPMDRLYKKGIGSLAYRDTWNLFDQILLNDGWMKPKTGYRYMSVRINNSEHLRNGGGRFKGYPYRTYNGSQYTGGYSDHFAVYVVFIRN